MHAIASPARQRLSKMGRCALSLMLALFFAVPTSLLSAAKSPASQAFGEEGQMWISIGESISYSGYSTNYFTAGGRIAWCIEPNSPSPDSGWYDFDIHRGSESVEWRAAAIAFTAATLDSSFDEAVPGSAADGADRMGAFWDAIEKAAYTGGDQSCTFYTRMHVMLSYCFEQAAHRGVDPFYGASDKAVWQEKCSALWEFAMAAAQGQAYDGLFTAEQAQYMAAIANDTVIGMSHGGSAQNIAWVESVGLGQGDLDLVKVSDSPSLTDGNACYSLAGAVYGVYNSREDAESGSNPVTTMTTDANGYAKSCALDQGTYYVRETWASQSFGVDTAVHEAWVEAGSTRRVNGETVPEPAKNDPTFIRIAKTDANGAESAQGAATLAGAEYAVEYFDGWYGSADEARAAKAATRTWTFATDENGMINLNHAADYKVSGDDLYVVDGEARWPMGTYVIHETKAPTGYLVSGKTYSMRVFTDENGDVTRVGNEGGSTYVVEGNTYVGDAETVQRGDYAIAKTASTAPEGNASDGGGAREPVAGVKFELYNASDAAVVSPETGKSVEPGGLVCTIATDADGKASTAAGKAVNGWDVPAGWSGALAFGSYSVHEVIPQNVQDAYFAKHGMNIRAASDWKISISKDKQSDPATEVNNTVAQTPLKIVKVDAESGKQVPLPCTFRVLDADKNPVTYTKDGKTADTFTTGTDGTVTLPMLLPQGTYYVSEVSAPDGYAVSDALPSFQVTADTYNDWNSPIEVVFPDPAIKGVIELSKTDSETGAALSGAEFDVVAVSDVTGAEGTVHAKAGEVVDHVVTGEDGKATTKQLHIGAYNVVETKAPAGHVLDTTPHAASVVSQGQSTPVVTVSVAVADAPTKVVFKKTASDTGAALAGATFEVYDPAGMTASGYDVYGIKSALEAAFNAPNGKIANWDAVKNDAAAGKFAKGDTVELTYSFTDPETNEANEFEVVATFADGYEVDLTYADRKTAAIYGKIATVEAQQSLAEGFYSATVTTGADGSATLKGLEPGDYAVREVAAPAGYHEQLAGKTWKLAVDAYGKASFEGGSAAACATLSVKNDANTMGTTAASGEGTKYVSADGTATIVDKVRYLGTVKGQTYTVTGTLHAKDIAADGTIADAGAVTDSEGKAVTATATFIADAQSGEAEVTFTFDASALVGRHVVAFERMYDAQGRLVASHEDIGDDGQSVRVQPTIGTELLAKVGDGADGAYIELSAEEAARIIGEGSVNDGSDPEKGDPADTRYYAFPDSAAAALTPGSAEYKEMVETTAAVSGMTADEVKILAANSGDAGSVVTYGGTELATPSWSHTAAAYEGEMTLVDTVGYIGLTPGVEHVAKGTLMSSETGSALTDANGNPVTAEATFTPNTVSGAVQLEFHFTAGEIEGTSTVAFEEVYEKVTETEVDEETGEETQAEKEVLIAEHKNLQDEGQTVSFPSRSVPSTPGETYDKTSDMMRAAAPFMAGALAAAAGAAVYGLRQRKLYRAESAGSGIAGVAGGDGAPNPWK